MILTIPIWYGYKILLDRFIQRADKKGEDVFGEKFLMQIFEDENK